MRKRYIEIRNANAANLSMKHALRAALEKIDPKHPLIINKVLQEEVHKSGERAFLKNLDWNSAKLAGETFKIPR